MKTVKDIVAVIVVGFQLFASSGCATMISGSRQKLTVDMKPANSEVSVYRWNGERVAGPLTSPGESVLPRPKWDQPYLLPAA